MSSTRASYDPLMTLTGNCNSCLHVRMPDGARHDTRSNHAGDVGDVGQQTGTNRIGNLAKTHPVGNPRIGGIPGYDHLRLALPGQVLYLVVVQPLAFSVNAVGDDVVELA